MTSPAHECHAPRTILKTALERFSYRCEQEMRVDLGRRARREERRVASHMSDEQRSHAPQSNLQLPHTYMKSALRAKHAGPYRSFTLLAIASIQLEMIMIRIYNTRGIYECNCVRRTPVPRQAAPRLPASPANRFIRPASHFLTRPRSGAD